MKNEQLDEKNKNLFSQLKNGDENARKSIILLNKSLVYYLFYKYNFNIFGNDEDIISCGIIGLIKSVDKYDLSKNASFSSYASVIIKNEFIRYYKENKSKINTCTDIIKETDTSIFNFISDPTLDVEEQALLTIQVDELYKAIDKLNEKEKILLEEFYGLNGKVELSAIEIAQKYNITRQYVSYNLKNIRKKLQIKMQSKIR